MINHVQSPSFRAIYPLDKNEYSPHQAEIMNGISEKLGKEIGITNKTFLEYFEDLGYDFFFVKGDDSDSVKVLLSESKNGKDKKKVKSFIIGKYNDAKDFNVHDSNILKLYPGKKHLTNLMQSTTALFILAGTMIIASLIKPGKTFNQYPSESIKTVIADTLKAKGVNSEIKEIKNGLNIFKK